MRSFVAEVAGRSAQDSGLGSGLFRVTSASNMIGALLLRSPLPKYLIGLTQKASCYVHSG